jgi:hypothetical protein
LNRELSEWDGAAESVKAKEKVELSEEEEAWRSAYYHDVILPDEKRFLVSAAMDHLKFVEGVSADEGKGGKKVAFVEGGKGLVQVCAFIHRKEINVVIVLIAEL